MGSIHSHLDGAKRERDNLRALAGSDLGNMHGITQHACLSVEHLLKAILASEHGGQTDLTGHNLVFFMRETDMYIPEEQASLVYKIDGLYTTSRYDSDLDEGAVRDLDALIQDINNFYRWVTTFIESKESM